MGVGTRTCEVVLRERMDVAMLKAGFDRKTHMAAQEIACCTFSVAVLMKTEAPSLVPNMARNLWAEQEDHRLVGTDRHAGMLVVRRSWDHAVASLEGKCYDG
jgi:hypothetical protein